MEKKRSFLSKTDVLSFGAYFGSGAVGQLFGEALKVIGGNHQDKFPEGWDSFNVAEEVLEGGLSTLGGAIAAKILYHILVSQGKIEYSRDQEQTYMLYGAIAGYISMAIILGPLIHELSGVSDVKWGPF
jgi:hypothetical protein